MPNLIVKDGKVTKILPDTEKVKNCEFADSDGFEELIFALKELEWKRDRLDDYVSRKPWYEKLWDKVLRSEWYHRLWEVSRVQPQLRGIDNEN